LFPDSRREPNLRRDRDEPVCPRGQSAGPEQHPLHPHPATPGERNGGYPVKKIQAQQ